MEITLYIMLMAVTLFFTYINYSSNHEHTPFLHYMTGVLWIALALNVLVVLWFIPTQNDYIPLTKNSEWYQLELAVLYGIIGIGILISEQVTSMGNGEDAG
jgi:hypothetical protein